MGSLMSVPYQHDMHVVIVGGGYGGAYLAALLKKKDFCKLTLIDPKDCMIHCVAALRASVQKGYAKKVFVPLEQVAGDSFVRGRVVKIDKENKTVILESGVKITYTHLVIATGSTSPFPGKIVSTHPNVSAEDGIKVYDEYALEIEKSNQVVCVGGGAVGVEMAAEIKVEFPDKEVTLIHSNKGLASGRLRDDVQSELKEEIEKLGIKLMLGERVQNIDELTLNKSIKGQVVKTKSGKGIIADLVIPCTGNKPNNEFFKDDLVSSLTETGFLKVDDFFQIEGEANLYAIGDVTNSNEEKLAYVAKLHAELLVDNWIAEATGSQKKTYKPESSFTMLIPLGRNGGIGELKGIKVGGFVTKTLKSSDLFSAKIWGDMGVKPPKV